VARLLLFALAAGCLFAVPVSAQPPVLDMTYRYVEIAGGDHVSVAWKTMPEVFAFFDRHKRGEPRAGR
jgi:hypothetical protein